MLKKIINRFKNDIKLENASPEQRDDELFVAKSVAKHGAGEFKMASSRLKSDAKFVLDLVKTRPECLCACSNVLFDRYEKNGEMVEVPVNDILFAAMCCDKNVECFKYLTLDIAKEYLNAVEQGKTLEGVFQGKKCVLVLNLDEDYVDLLKYVRCGYIKSNSIYVGCMLS